MRVKLLANTTSVSVNLLIDTYADHYMLGAACYHGSTCGYYAISPSKTDPVIYLYVKPGNWANDTYHDAYVLCVPD